MLGGEGTSSDGRLGEAVDVLLGTAPGAQRLLLFFDQAEAIFLLPSKQEQTLFLALLDRLRRVDRCVVVLAMRADFYADLMMSVLWPVSPGEQVEIGPLRSAALREAIVRPAAEAGVQLEPVLVERLVRDAGEEPGALSLVQETMVLLWERRTRRLLTVSAWAARGAAGWQSRWPPGLMPRSLPCPPPSRQSRGGSSSGWCSSARAARTPVGRSRSARSGSPATTRRSSPRRCGT